MADYASGAGAQTLDARKTSNAVVDRDDNQRDQNGQPIKRGVFDHFKNAFGSRFTPPVEMPKVAALEPSRRLNPSLLPAVPSTGLNGLDDYKASQAHVGNDVTTLFHPQPPTNVQFPRAVDSQNILAVPPRFTMSPLYQVYSKPRKGTPGHNPMGVNDTPTV